MEPVSDRSLTPWRRNDPILTSLSPSDPSSTLLLLVPRAASAQFSGVIQGTITDSQKAVVADAVVMVHDVCSGPAGVWVTTSDGVFRVLSLGPGVYRVEVVKLGFWNALRESVSVGISETVRLDFTLEVSGVQGERHGHDQRADRRDRAGSRVRAVS